MNNLTKRVLTSIIIFPLSIFFIYEGENLLLLFLFTIFFVANYELFSVFNKRVIILLLDLILIISLYSIYYLRESGTYSLNILLWVILLCVFSDIGGYVFGKTFKWKKLTKISPKKTLSGAFGSFIFSLFSVFVAGMFLSEMFFEAKYFFLSILFSLIAQSGDLLISYFKRIEKIKDTGKILPGHGGIFDRIDGLMFVVILVFILIYFDTGIF